MKNLFYKRRLLPFLFVIAGSFMTASLLAQTPGLQNCTITATGTGKTTGGVVAMTIYNPSDKEVKDILGPYYISSGGSYQPYITMEKIPVTVPGGKTINITLKGFCADITKQPMPNGQSFPALETWTTINPQQGTVVFADKVKKTDASNPGIIGPIYFGALDGITKAYDNLKATDAITTPFSTNPEKEREAVIQQTFWLYTSQVNGNPYTKEQFTDRTYAQFEDNTKQKTTSIPPEQKQSLDNGITAFWNTFEAVGVNAKILNPSATTPAQLYDVTDLKLGFGRNDITIWIDGETVVPNEGEKVQVHFYGNNTIVIFFNGSWQAGFLLTDDGSQSIPDTIAKYSDADYPEPQIDCDSLERICKKTAAFNVFWGDIYSIFDQKLESRRVAGETLDKHSEKSLLISRGWMIDCCTGEYSLNLFFQSMQGSNDGHSGDKSHNISFSKKLKVGKPCPVNCPECKEKCKKQMEDMQKAQEDMKKAQEAKKGN